MEAHEAEMGTGWNEVSIFWALHTKPDGQAESWEAQVQIPTLTFSASIC
jgi:hypothetical protein